MMFSGINLFAVSTAFLMLVSCGGNEGIKFDPDLWKTSSILGGIVSEREDFIACYEEEFDDFGAIHKDKIKELRTILQNATTPKRMINRKRKLINYLDNFIQNMEK